MLVHQLWYAYCLGLVERMMWVFALAGVVAVPLQMPTKQMSWGLMSAGGLGCMLAQVLQLLPGFVDYSIQVLFLSFSSMHRRTCLVCIYGGPGAGVSAAFFGSVLELFHQCESVFTSAAPLAACQCPSKLPQGRVRSS